MQQKQPERHFSDAPSQQPVYRFPQNQSAQGYQPQQTYHAYHAFQDTTPELSAKDQRKLKKTHRRSRKRRFSLLWNIFAIIGMLTVIIQAVRYLVIPLLVYLNVMSGGAL